MKKLVINIAILLSTSLVSYAIIVLIILTSHLQAWFPGNEILSGKGFTLSKTREVKKYSSVDVLFLGSSNVLRGVDTRIFEQHGIKAFNFGTSSQSVYNSYFLLKEYRPLLKPKYVVLDLYWPVIAGDGVESTVDIVSNHELTYNMIEMAARTHNMITIRNLIAVSLLRLIKRLDFYQVKEDFKRKYVHGGFVASSYIDTVGKTQRLAGLSTLVKLPSDMQLKYLNKFIRLCKKTNTKLIMTVSPVSKEFRNKLKNYDDYTNTISAIANKNNIIFIDYNQEHKLNTNYNDYSDLNHMTSYGASKFTRVLLNDFASICKGYNDIVNK
jgi:hypothetical protein